MSIQFTVPILVVGAACIGLCLIFVLGASQAADSKLGGIKTAVLFAIGFVFIFLAKVAELVRAIGARAPVSKLYAALFKFYPGTWFAEMVRDDFVNESLLYIRQGVVEVDEREQEELVGHFETAQSYSGVRISDGEAALALILVGLSVFSFGPSWLLTLITLALAVTVSIRLVSLDVLLYDNHESVDDTDRLEIMLAWNEYVINRVTFASIVELRTIYDFDERLYRGYMRRGVRQQFVDSSASHPEQSHRFLQQCIVVTLSKIRDEDAEELSRKRYDKNVLEFSEAPSSSKHSDLNYNDE